MESKIRIGLQPVLNGWVGPETRAITASWSSDHINVCVYSDGDVPRNLVDEFRAEIDKCFAPVVDPDYDGHPSIAVEFIDCHEPERINHKGIVVFCRRGTQFAT